MNIHLRGCTLEERLFCCKIYKYGIRVRIVGINASWVESVTIISRTRSWREDGVYTFLSCQTAVKNFDVRKLNKFEPEFEHRSNFSDLEADKRAKAEETFNAERSNINIFQPLSKIRQGMGVGSQNLIPRYPLHNQPLGHWTVLMSL